MTVDEQARRARAAERARAMVIHKSRLGAPEHDFTPVRGADALSLVTRLTVEAFSLAGMLDASPSGNRAQVRFVPRAR